ncbi:hypothetical protein F8R89_00975 [Streptomyces sp. SS1-1]|uniref:hypothetical protein n=1 Tax=Streptomyces sp. SS1-1 TaxID=2651869 RepID=UPI0012501DBF|nr:hypothetical protein [Streptomyces sp. SS1-1]KAB2977451.1 hypothetical protein F8R89_00975 [Streptomyces sp. SS1-1]
MHIDLSAIVVLVLGGLAVYVAYKKPELGTPLGLGAVIITLLVLLLQSQDSPSTDSQDNKSPQTSGQTCSADEDRMPS